jgi:hypothetical protein
MITLYETARGDYAPAQSLTPAEAVELRRRGWLPDREAGYLSRDARRAVALAVVGVRVSL